MNSTPVRSVAAPIGQSTHRVRAGRRARAWAAFAVAFAGFSCPLASAQDGPTTPVPSYAQRIVEGKTPVEPDSGITQAGCSSCGLSPTPMITGGYGGCSSCGSGGGSGDCGNGCPTGKCKPGRRCGSCTYDFERPEGCGKVARLFGGLFDCVCCPDPCYEPCWTPVANSAFFQDAARPHSQMRLRWDAGINMIMPDRNEYFWARIGQKGPPNREASLNYNELTIYNETATGAFGFFIEMPYRLLETDLNGWDAGWGDMNLGTKSMLVDCELWQLTFQFKTYIPIASARKGLGVGHVSLEPSLLSTLKLAPRTYLQSQLSEWIPIAGDDTFAGLIMHYHLSLNHEWCRRGAFQFINTLEFNGYSFQDGALTNPVGFPDPTAKSSNESYLYAGPGFRLVYCDRFDLGVGMAFSLTDDHFAETLYRTEFRIRY